MEEREERKESREERGGEWRNEESREKRRVEWVVGSGVKEEEWNGELRRVCASASEEQCDGCRRTQ